MVGAFVLVPTRLRTLSTSWRAARFCPPYPYPFIDVLVLGYARTIVNAIAFLIGFIALEDFALHSNECRAIHLDSPRRPA